MNETDTVSAHTEFLLVAGLFRQQSTQELRGLSRGTDTGKGSPGFRFNFQLELFQTLAERKHANFSNCYLQEYFSVR